MNKIVEIDRLGRIVIPIEIRNKFRIKKDNILLLSLTLEGFILKIDNDNSKYDKIIEKLTTIENILNIDFVLTNNNVIYASYNYKYLINKEIKKINKSKILKNEKINVINDVYIHKYVWLEVKITSYEKANLFIIYKNTSEEKLARAIKEVFV